MPTASSSVSMSHSPSQPSTSTCRTSGAAPQPPLLLLPPLLLSSSLSELLSTDQSEPAMVLVLLALMLLADRLEESGGARLLASYSPLLAAAAAELSAGGRVRVTASGSVVNPSGTAPAARQGAEGRGVMRKPGQARDQRRGD